MDKYIGERFGKLVIVSLHHTTANYQKYYVCKCDCGNEKIIRLAHLKSGSIVSCGCYKPQEKLVKSLVGQRFGKLVVLERLENNSYLCKCDCGNTTVVSASNLRGVTTRSCGCIHKEVMKNISKKPQSIIPVINNHQVLEYVGTNKHQKKVYKVKCLSCGKEKSTTLSALKSGNAGCRCKMKFEDLSGKSFGSLTVLRFTEKRNNKRFYLCKCSCGNEVEVCGEHLKSGHTKSCGCSRKGLNNKLLRLDYMGTKWGSLTAIKPLGTKNLWLFKCDCGNLHKAFFYNVRSGNTTSCGCLNVSHSGSKAELEIKEYIETMATVEQHNRELLEGKEIDIYIPEYKIGMEYNGSAYHATVNNIYENKPKTYHRDKFLSAKHKGIHLIQIFDVDWDRNQDKIKMYLKSLLMKNERIYARQTKIVKLSKQEAHEFIDQYHIQGKAQLGAIAYGLVKDGVLYSVMTFDRLRMKTAPDNHFELHRYCVRDGYTVLGGAEKLFKHFINEYNPPYILSYSDNDYFLGGIYERLKFENAGQCTPRYYWYLNGVELKREKCQLKHLRELYPELLQEAYDVNASNKEVYVMQSLGAQQVWRSGNTKWEWKSCQKE